MKTLAARSFMGAIVLTCVTEGIMGPYEYLDLLPTEYAWWLKRREQIREISK